MVHRLVHENAVQNAARIGIQTERDVADAEDGLHLGQLLLDRLHRLQRFDAGGAVIFLTGRDGQGQRVEDRSHRANAVLVHRQIEDALGDGQLLLPGQRHAVFVDGQRDDGRAVALGHRQNFRRALLAIFQVDGVDDGLARNALQRFLDHVGLGGIDGDGRGHTSGDLLQDVADVALLVLAHDGAAQVEHVRAFVHQLLGQGEDRVIVLRPHHVLEVLDAGGGVHLLGHDQRLGIEVERHHGVRAGCSGRNFHFTFRRLEVGAGFRDRLQVLGRGAAAAAHNAHAVLGDELLVIVGQLLRLQQVHRTSALRSAAGRRWAARKHASANSRRDNERRRSSPSARSRSSGR